MSDQLHSIARSLLAENYWDGVRAIDLYAARIVDQAPDTDLARVVSHIATSDAADRATKTKLIQSLLRKLHLGLEIWQAPAYARAA